MKTYLDCIPCFLRQALKASRLATNDEILQKKAISEVAKIIPCIRLHETPVEIGERVHYFVRKITKNPDPYKPLKEKYNHYALALYPKLKKFVENSKDKLLTGVRIAVAGNIIDFGALSNFDINESLKSSLSSPFSIFDYEIFRSKIESGTKILYILDNAGEIVFDMVLIEYLKEMGKQITAVVRGGPVLNDATMEDAIKVGLTEKVKVITSGTQSPGIIFKNSSTEFQREFLDADVIICKGQGNYEGLSYEKAPLFFLLKVKCPVIARDIGVEKNSLILEAGKWMKKKL